MKLHQVLTGAANVLENSVAVGHGIVSGYPFTVYGSGYEVVILDSHFTRVQIISNHEEAVSSIVKSIACCLTDGKVVVSFGKTIILYEPFSNKERSEKLPFQWRKITTLSFESDVCKLCWDQEGKRLLVGSDSLTIWREESCEEESTWNCVWKRKLASPVKLLEFSPDGHFFGSAGNADRMIKIWFRAPRVSAKSQCQKNEDVEEDYNFIYIQHPEAVQSFSWRQTSKHMPMCLVPNVLLTSCDDDICRVWTETVKYKPSHHHTPENSKTGGTNNRKERSESEIKHQTANDMHVDEKLHLNQSYHLVSIYHFHLAAIINPKTDIALLSSIPTQSIFGRSFQLQWLNNKEVEFTTAVEAIFASLKEKTNESQGNSSLSDMFLLVDEIDGELRFEDDIDSDVKTLDQTLDEDQIDVDSGMESQQSSLSLKPPVVENTLVSPETDSAHGMFSTCHNELHALIHRWCSTSDTIYCIHPVDGSLLIWVIDFLDDFTSAYYRQVQVSLASRIPATFTKADASSLCWSYTFHLTQAQLKPSTDNSNKKDAPRLSVNTEKETEQLTVLQSSYMVSAHADGSLNLWLVAFSESGSFTGIASMTHVTRSCGPRFETTQLVCHPVLPLVVGASLRTKASNPEKSIEREIPSDVNDIQSELILWHTDHVSPLSEYKGVTEMARISSPNPKQFSKISWVPTLYHHSLLSIANEGVDLLPNAPCACFVAASNDGLSLYQILLDAKILLSTLSMMKSSTALPDHMERLSKLIESEQSGSQSACIMKICDLENSSSLQDLNFLHVFSRKTLQRDLHEDIRLEQKLMRQDHDDLVVVAISSEFGQQKVSIWNLKVTQDNKFDIQHSSPKSPPSVCGDYSPLTPTSPIISGSSFVTPLVISHCLKQHLVYEESLCKDNEKIKQFSAAVDVHSSGNLNISLPVKFHIAGHSEESIRFWTLHNMRDKTVSISECAELPINLEWTEEIVDLQCADHCRFAYIKRKRNNTNETCNYSLHVKESESSGESGWGNEYSTIFCVDSEASGSHLVELSWLSLENGLYMLAAAVKNTVYIFCKKRIAILGSAKGTKHTFKWDILKQVQIGNNLKNDFIRLKTISWSGGGFFMIGVENEVQVYSQWEDNKYVIFRRQNLLTTLLNDNADQGVILTTNSFTMACENMNCLPQYHPYHLMELLNLGKLRRVRAILRHLVRCVAGFEVADAAVASGDVSLEQPLRSRARTLTKTYSTLSEHSCSPNEVPIAEINENKPDSDLDLIPPLMLSKLLQADKDQSGKVESDDYENNYCDLSNSAVFYGPAQANLLMTHLSKKHLPGLSSQEQMYLLALSDTVASSKEFDLEGMDMSESRKYRTKENDSNFSSLSGGSSGGGYATTGATGVGDFASDSLDECGLKFLIFLRHHTALLKSLTPKQKSALEEKGMLSSEYCWAFHSDCEEELIAMLPGMSRNETTWSVLKAHGAGWWIRSTEVLKRTIEKVSKVHFQIKKDPLDCAIFYLAMKKKSLLCALYRSMRDTKMSTFFNNDFTQERWRKAALKNAYALLGKQRFEHAAAFFLLGNALWDAVQVCVTRLDDIQLALVIARLYENNLEDTHRKILCSYIVGYDSEKPCPDPFKRSMAHWLLKEYHESVDVLFSPFREETESPSGTIEEHSNSHKKHVEEYDYPSIFNFYHYLHTHPLIRRSHLCQHNPDARNYSADMTGVAVPNMSNEEARKYERSLYFRTACIHLNSGLPDIALEVLSMLPSDKPETDKSTDEQSNSIQGNLSTTEDMIVTGTFSGDLEKSNQIGNQTATYSSMIDTGSFGWGGDADFSMTTNRFSDLDDGYKIGISLSDDDDDDDNGEKNAKDTDAEDKNDVANDVGENDKNGQIYDIAALHLKYRCIIQLLIEGLKSLPVKCTQEKLKLRGTLKRILRDELEFLHNQCDYRLHNEDADLKTDEVDNVEETKDRSGSMCEVKAHRTLSSISDASIDQNNTTHESSIKDKVEQISIQSEWLKRNQQILSGLYEHCLMVGTGDPELPAVCLELLLLLHEIEDHRVLNAPLTSLTVGPSAPPLLLASMTSFSLVASPIDFLKSMAHDLLQTFIDLPALPTPTNPVKRLADLENLMCSLSSCIYHSLCGGDDDRLLASIKKGETELVGKQMRDGKLCRIPHGATDIEINVTSSPTQWPGVKFLLSILSVNKKDDRNILNLLLCESAVAIYLSIFVSACSRLSCNNLYRYVNNGLTEKMWNQVFGGGTKIVIPAPDELQPKGLVQKDLSRSKYVHKMLREKGQEKKEKDTPPQVSFNDSQKLVRHELFIPPNYSLCDYFLMKPVKNNNFDYESDDEEEDDDDDDNDDYFDGDEIVDDGLIDEEILRQKAEEIRRKKAKFTEHFESSSYPWLIMQLALVEITFKNINDFISLAGLEASDLPTQSPLLYNATKILMRWEQLLRVALDSCCPQEESLITYIPPYDGDGVARGGIMLQKTKVLLDPQNTPFSNLGKRVQPAKRLWHTLVHQERIRPLFLHYAFKCSSNIGDDSTDYEVITGHLLHKDLEPVTSICINRSNMNYMAISTTNEIIEYDVSGSMEVDIMTDNGINDTDLMFDMMREKKQARVKSAAPVEIQRRQFAGIRRIDSHPTLPYYVAGGNDGSVRMFEFIHPDEITLFRKAGQCERVNKITFNPMGNKFAAVDDSGFLCIWLVANTNDTSPICSLKCHSKHCYDFAFLGSSSLIGTVGSSSDKKNVCIWDTLLPQHKALVHNFSHSNHGAQSITYVPGQQCIITGGKRGDICIFDIRQRRLLHTFNAHDSLIKTIKLDPMEMFFVTGAVDGDIKIWGLSTYELIEGYPKEHARGSVSLRQVSPGVQCLLVLNGRKVFSCGGDGTVKWRSIRNKHSTRYGGCRCTTLPKRIRTRECFVASNQSWRLVSPRSKRV